MLHDLRPGTLWQAGAIAARLAPITAAGMTWDVMESLPVSAGIRTGSPLAGQHIATWIASTENLADAGPGVVC